MSRFKPYHCIQFNLAQKNNWSELPSNDYGFYVVLWYNEIPAGHFFVNPGETLTRAEFGKKLVHASSWALRHYAKNSSIKAETIHDVQKIFNYVLNTPESIPEICSASVVICTKDRPESLKQCLESLTHSVCKPAEIIVVDNASASNQTIQIAEAYPGIKYIREENVGLDKARNAGAKAATQPIVIYTDDDTTLHPLWVYQTCKTFDDPSVAAMTGLVLAAELQTEAQWLFEMYWPFNRGFTDKKYDRNFFSSASDKVPPVWTIGAGANMAFRKEIFNTAGYFDERLDVGAAGCSGDSEIWYRILAAGKAIQYNPRAVVWHFHREAMTGFQKQIFYYMRGFTTAVLIQHQRFRHKGNLKHLLLELPKYYLWLFIKGFPFYKGRNKTILSEMRGILSGILFYLKNRNTPSNIFN